MHGRGVGLDNPTTPQAPLKQNSRPAVKGRVLFLGPDVLAFQGIVGKGRLEAIRHGFDDLAPSNTRHISQPRLGDLFPHLEPTSYNFFSIRPGYSGIVARGLIFLL